jgi:hypothetical protein
MKGIINLFVFLLSAQIVFAIPLNEAIQKNLVSATFESNGIHRGKSLTVFVENKSNQNLQIEILNGTYLEHEEEGYQDHIIVENYMIALNPLEKKDLGISALCIEPYNSCPKQGSKFSIKPYDDKSVLELCKLIMKTKEFEYTGQNALWELIKNGDPNQIEGGDSLNVVLLRNFLAEELGKRVLPYNPSDYDRPLTGTGYNLSLWVEGNYYLKNIEGGETIEYGIFDENHNPISEVKQDKTEPNFWKKHNVEFRFDVDGLDVETKYFLQIKVEGVIRKEWMYRYQG